MTRMPALHSPYEVCVCVCVQVRMCADTFAEEKKHIIITIGLFNVLSIHLKDKLTFLFKVLKERRISFLQPLPSDDS